MELPASLREVNPVVDQMARGEPVHDGPALGLAVALGLATPERCLTEAGRAYARPALANGPLSLVMSPERRAAAQPLLSGPLPLQASLRRLLRRIAAQGEGLVAPNALGWPEALLRPYLSYLEDLGLLVAIGPLVEVTPSGKAAAALPEPARAWPAWANSAQPGAHAPGAPSFANPVFRYLLVRQACLGLLTLRGKREWHLLQPLVDGSLSMLKLAYNEWLDRFQASQPSVRRSWAPDLVARFAAANPAPAWFAPWCVALFGTEPSGALEALSRSPSLCLNPAMLEQGLPDREAWILAVALARASRRGWSLRYDRAAARLQADGLAPGSWPEMQERLEAVGLLVNSHPDEIRLLLPVEIHPPEGALWPYGGPEWVVAALLEGDALTVPSPSRRPARV
jgi:hypothetical protein